MLCGVYRKIGGVSGPCLIRLMLVPRPVVSPIVWPVGPRIHEAQIRPLHGCWEVEAWARLCEQVLVKSQRMRQR